jgi:hypothetical protein
MSSCPKVPFRPGFRPWHAIKYGGHWAGWRPPASALSSLAARSRCFQTPHCPRTCHGRPDTPRLPARSPKRAVIDSAGARSLPRHVRDLVNARLSGHAVGIGLSSSWVDQAVAEVPAADRAVAKLALLTALASFQIDADVVASARHDCADDAALIDLTAWASLTAARRSASRYLHASRRSRYMSAATVTLLYH